MAGIPAWFNVVNLEILEVGDPTGSPTKDVIQLGVGGDPFDLLATFEANPAAGTWWGLAEVLSDLNPGMVPGCETKFFFESIGPGPEFFAGSPVVLKLTQGGNVGAGPGGESVYEARFNVPNADTLFVDNGNPAPGTYVVGCSTEWDIQGFTAWFASGTYSKEQLIIKVAWNQ
jgi:hypothetical protein